MKNASILYIFLLVFAAQFAMATNYKSRKTVHAGDWTLNTNWTNNQAPSISVNNSENVDIEGFIKVNSTLTVGGDIVVTDTLYVESNMVVSGNPTITVNGLLIIKGSLSSNGNFSFNISGNGIVVVLDDVSVAGNGNGNGNSGKVISNTGIIYINDAYSISDFTNTSTSNLDAAINMPADLMAFVELQTGSTLPVVLAYFEATDQENIVKLDWATATEENFDYFVIERSKDAINYEPIAQVKGAGWSQSLQKYAYSDLSPLYGVTYYRLKSVDFDGYTEYFSPVSVVVESEIKPEAQIINNPYNRSSVEIYYRNGNDEPAQVRIVDMNGRFILETMIATGNEALSLPQNIQQGIYLVYLETRNYSKSFKFMIN